MALTSSPEQPQPLRVVVGAVKEWVERCSAIWVAGQIVEIKRRSGATQFMTLRDPLAEVSVTVTLPTAVLDAAGPITEGAKVAALVRPTVWTATGRLSFECTDLRPSGEGRLLVMVEQRKRMLQAEGLFDPARKKRLPFLPRVIGLVTAKDSAAEADVLTVVRRRWPAAAFEVRHCLMQGQNAAAQVMESVAILDRQPAVDVIIIARGGGSFEDLLPFSDEGLVRTVAACRTPVVSAIGHESDTPVLDLVADLRASTPTDAAKQVVPDVVAEGEGVRQMLTRLRLAITTRLDAEARGLADLRSRPVLRDPLGGHQVHVDQVTQLRERAIRAVTTLVRDESTQVSHALERVRAMSPKATLERGYAILVQGDGATSVTSLHDVDEGDDLYAHLADGSLVVEVREVQSRHHSAPELVDGPSTKELP